MHPLKHAARCCPLILLFMAGWLHAQSSLDTGSLRGKVQDVTGKPLPGAIIRAKGPQGVRSTQADFQGIFNLPFLTPGQYDVTVTMDGFTTQMQSGVSVIAQQITGQSFKLAEGSDIVVVKAGSGVDLHSATATTRVNLGEAMQAFAQSHSFTAAFDFAPGAIANSGVGGGNYSIGGASGLENQYFVGGVNITNSGYGAIGAYDVVRGATGTGITTEFLDNLDIREGGFEAEYGGALGGVISATVRSGSNDFHGAATAYYTPRSLNGARRSFIQAGGILNDRGSDNLDLAVEVGGPIIKDRLFFFAGYNPIWSKDFFQFNISPDDLAKDEIVAPFANVEYDQGRKRVDNYAAHLTWLINEKHKLDLAVFGSPEAQQGLLRGIGPRVDPVDDTDIPVNPPVAGGVPETLPVDGASGQSSVRDFSASLKYFGTLRPWMSVEAVVSFHRNQVSETPGPGADSLLYIDRRRLDIFNAQTRAAATIPGVPPTPVVSPATYRFGGLGFYQGGSSDQNLDTLLKVTHNFNLAGEHELKWGADYADLKYRENVLYTGPHPTVFLHSTPITNPTPAQIDADSWATVRTGVQAQVRCINVNVYGRDLTTACRQQRYRVNRGNFNPPTPDTSNRELNLFVQDKWTIRNVTLNLGVRWTREKIGNPSTYSMRSTISGNPLVDSSGNPVGSRNADCVANNQYTPDCYLSGPGVFSGTAYSFKGEFAPRIGATWDVLGNGKSKLYANFARLFERVPNDLAVRSFGNEFGVTNISFVNPDLTGQNRVAFTTGAQPTRVQPGTRLPYKDDFILGYQFEIRPRFLVDFKANYRKQGRILEDTQTATVESIQNFYYDGFLLVPFACQNCAPGQTELFPGAGASPFREYVLANVGENSPSSFRDALTGAQVPVSFGSPKSEYRAVSLTLTKQPAEGQHLWLQATYRLARLTGNYEGLFRNDNGQSDPNITSLFDFPDSPLLHTQYLNGRLNTDTPHSLKINVGYNDLFIKNLYGALSFKWQSGQLRTPLLAHPIYQNAGEIPGINPNYYLLDITGLTGLPDGIPDTFILKDYTSVQRGYLGRQSDDAVWDFKLGYKWLLGRSNLDFSVLVSNVFNDNHVSRYDNNVEITTGVTNPVFGNPVQAKPPRSIRLGAKWSF